MKTWVKILIIVSAIVGMLLTSLVVVAIVTTPTAPTKAPIQHQSTVQPTPTKQSPVPVLTGQEYASMANPEHGKIISSDVNNDHPEYGPTVLFTVYMPHPTVANIEQVSSEIAQNMSGAHVEMVMVWFAHTKDLDAPADYRVDLIPVHPINKINAVKASDVHNYYTSGDFYVSNPTAQ